MQEKINYPGSKMSVKRILHNLNFKYRKCNDGRRFLMERNDIVACRIKFLRKMYGLRQNNDTRLVVYLDETWVNQNHTQGYIWQNPENTEGLKVGTNWKGCSTYCMPRWFTFIWICEQFEIGFSM